MADNRYKKRGDIAMELITINSGTYLAHSNGKFTLCIGKKNKAEDLKLPRNCILHVNCDGNKSETLANIKYDFAGIEFDIPVTR